MIAITETRMNATSAGLLAQAEALFLAGDLRRASGKAWDAVEYPLSAMMRERDWSCGDADEMGRLFRFGNFLSKESDDREEFIGLLGVAGSMYVNSHEGWHTADMVEIGIRAAEELTTFLDRIAEHVRRG